MNIPVPDRYVGIFRAWLYSGFMHKDAVTLEYMD